jgi:hypothetical protein
MTALKRDVSWQASSVVVISSLLLAVVLCIGQASSAAAHDAPAAKPASAPPSASAALRSKDVRRRANRGLVHPYRGLVRPPRICNGLFRIKGTRLCTHGPDPAPGGTGRAPHRALRPTMPRPPARLLDRLGLDNVPFPNFPHSRCSGGTSGFRTQVIYARAADVSSRYDRYRDSIRKWAADADEIFDQSAAETGGSRHIRFVHGSDCQPSVANVELDARGDDSFEALVDELKDQGFNEKDRKYMVFLDAAAPGVCGQGAWRDDDRPGQDNQNNSGPSYGVTYSNCWNDDDAGHTAAHELMHNLGAVRDAAPHATTNGHCFDEYDVMCYDDGPTSGCSDIRRRLQELVRKVDPDPYLLEAAREEFRRQRCYRHPAPPVQYLCANSSREFRFDCNHDDYYTTRRPVSGYLATHWNTATSRFLFSPECGALRRQIADLQRLAHSLKAIGELASTLKAVLSGLACPP